MEDLWTALKPLNSCHDCDTLWNYKTLHARLHYAFFGFPPCLIDCAFPSAPNFFILFPGSLTHRSNPVKSVVWADSKLRLEQHSESTQWTRRCASELHFHSLFLVLTIEPHRLYQVKANFNDPKLKTLKNFYDIHGRIGEGLYFVVLFETHTRTHPCKTHIWPKHTR